MTMRIGLYGGCFNPVHNGHVAAARGAMRALALDQVLFIPSGTPPMKGDDGLAQGAHRLAMLNTALASEARMDASAIEIEREGPSFTVDTVAQLKARYPADTELFFLLGDDCVERLPRWKGIDQLHAMLRFAILPRTRLGRRPADARLICLDLPRLEISSTQIRAMLATGERSSERWMHADVAQYIAQHRLYVSTKQAAHA